MEQAEEKVSLSTLAPTPGSRRYKQRKGIGEGSGCGKTCSTGHGGQKSRSGGRIPRGFEGGQMPLHRRLPKRGFNSRKRLRGENVYHVVSVDRLNALLPEGGDVTVEVLCDNGILSNPREKVKLLGGADAAAKFNVQVHAASNSAKAAVEAKGGEVQLISVAPRKKKTASE